MRNESAEACRVILELHLRSRDQQILQVRIINLFKSGVEEIKEELRRKFRKICMSFQINVAPGFILY